MHKMLRPGLQLGVATWAGTVGMWGCAGDSEMRYDSALLFSDSAGVEVVSFDADRLPPPVRVDPVPEWVLGEGQDSDLRLDLYRVVDVTALSDERVAVAEGSTQSILVLDRSEGTTKRLGGDGDGPSEFRAIARLFLSDEDALSAYDARRNRLLTFHLDGDVVEERSLPRVAASGNIPRLDIDGEGRIYLAVIPALPEGAGIERPRGGIFTVNEEVDTLTTVRGREVFRNSMGTGAVIFGSTTWTAADAGHGIWIGDTAEREIGLWRGSGGPTRIVRWGSDGLREVSESDIASFWAALDGAVPSGDPRPSNVMQDVLPFAEQWPAFGRLLVAGEGDLWVSRPLDPAVEFLSDEEPPPEEWTVVRFREGRAERVVTPGGFRVMEVRGDRLLGVHQDDLGVETVRQYRWQSP